MALRLVEVEGGRNVQTANQLAGWQGTLQDLEAMRAQNRRDLGLDNPATFNQTLFEVVGKIITAWQPRTDRERANAAFEFVIQNVIWTPDPVGDVRLPSTIDILNQRASDCDELVKLLASILGMMGFTRLAYRALLINETADGSFDHVELATILNDTNETLILDPSAQDKPAGWFVENPRQEIYLEIFDEGDGERLSGLIDSIAKIGTSFIGLFHKQGQSPAAIQAGANFDNAAKQVTTIFDTIQHKATITVDDYNKAAAAYNQLSQMANADNQIKFVTDKWNSNAYNATYQQRLAEIQAAALANQSSTAVATVGATNVLTGSGATSYAPYLIGAAVALFIGKMIFN